MSDRSFDEHLRSGAVSGIDQTAESRPFWIVLLFHGVLWTLLPVLFHPNAPLDVVEEISWGREWEWGYYKHPPLSAWLANAVYTITGGGLWSIFLLSQVCVAVCFWAVWKVALKFTDATRALAAVVLLEGVIYCNFTSPEFNPNVLELPIWALIVFFAWRAMSRDRFVDWIALGVFAGLGLLAKYYTAFLLVSVAIAFLVQSNRRWQWWKPLLSCMAALCIFLPHLLWLTQHDLATITYALERASSRKSLWTHLTYPLAFAAAQLLAVLGMFIALLVLYRRVRIPRWSSDPASRFLLTVALGPFVLTLLLSFVFNWKLRSMWGTPLWSFLPLLLLLATPAAKVNYRNVRFTGIALSCVMAVAFVIPLTVGPYVHPKPRKALFNGKAMAEQITSAWRGATGRPLEIAAGDTWVTGNLAFYSKDQPSTYTEANRRFSPWITDEMLRRSGTVIVWQDGPEPPAKYLYEFPNAQIQAPIAIPWHTRKGLEPAVVYWAIVGPQSKRRTN